MNVEERLYRSAAKAGIATITLSQRLALEEFHTQELRLGANNAQGWEKRRISAQTESDALLAEETTAMPQLHRLREEA